MVKVKEQAPHSALDALLKSRPKVTYWATAGIIQLNMILCVAQLSSYATGYDGSMMNGLQSLDSWQSFFNFPTGSTLGLFNAIQNIGQLASIPFEAIAVDRYGRKFGMLIGALIMILGCGLQGGAQTFGMFIAARALIGFGLGLSITAAPLLILELAHPSHRGPLTSLYNALWGLGSFAASWITYGTFTLSNDWSWRIPSILQALAVILQCATFVWIPESPRWLVKNGKSEKAREIITKYHANGDASDELIELEMAEIAKAIEVDAEVNKNSSYLTFFKGAANLKRTMIICFVGFASQWMGNGLTSYYLSLVLDSIGYTDSKQQLLINGILQAWGLVLGIWGAFLADKWGRRPLFLFSTAGILVTFVAWTICEATYEISNNSGNANAAAGKAVLAFIFLNTIPWSFGWSPLQVTYVIEILPLSMRARGLVIYNFTVSCALIFNQYANPVAMTSITWKYYIVYCVVIALCLIFVIVFFKETAGGSLEASAVVLDSAEIREKIEDASPIPHSAGDSIDEKTSGIKVDGSAAVSVLNV